MGPHKQKIDKITSYGRTTFVVTLGRNQHCTAYNDSTAEEEKCSPNILILSLMHLPPFPIISQYLNPIRPNPQQQVEWENPRPTSLSGWCVHWTPEHKTLAEPQQPPSPT